MIRLRRAVALTLALAAGPVAWGVVRLAGESRDSTTIARAREDAGAGRFDRAARSLATLPPGRLADPEVADLLGASERAAGRPEAALVAWSRIPADSPRSTPAALARADTLLTDLGRLADAEAILEGASDAPARPGWRSRTPSRGSISWRSAPPRSAA